METVEKIRKVSDFRLNGQIEETTKMMILYR